MISHLPRRSISDLAGIICDFKTKTHACRQYARYAVSHLGQNNELTRPRGVCGSHMPVVVRETWNAGNAAVVQEIPGMWRTHNANANKEPADWK